MTSAMHTAPRRLIRGLALGLVLTALNSPTAGAEIGASDTTRAATTTATAARHLPKEPKFPIPASARVHGSGAATTPASTGTTGVTGPASATAGTGSPATAAASGTSGPTGPTGATTGATGPTGASGPTGIAGVGSSAAGPPAGTRAVKGTTTTKLSTGAIVAAALAALLIVVCLLWGAARWWAYEPRWWVSLRHSLAEAGWRLSASWDEFSDWARIGR
jgi:hypothetical protein